MTPTTYELTEGLIIQELRQLRQRFHNAHAQIDSSCTVTDDGPVRGFDVILHARSVGWVCGSGATLTAAWQDFLDTLQARMHAHEVKRRLAPRPQLEEMDAYDYDFEGYRNG